MIIKKFELNFCLEKLILSLSAKGLKQYRWYSRSNRDKFIFLM